MFIAHIRQNGETQSVKEHCQNTAVIAANVLSDVHLDRTGYLAGLLHDMGKCSRAFYCYITDSFYGKPVKRGSVVHTFAGVRYMLENFHHTSSFSFADISCELITYAIGAHHGLFDVVDNQQCSGFIYRMEKHQEYYEEVKKNFLSECIGRKEIETCFERSQQEITACLQKIMNIAKNVDNEKANQELYFYLGLLARLLLSAIMEGDRKDTAAFIRGDASEDYLTKPELPPWKEILEHMESHIASLTSDTPIGIARKNISDQCRAFYDHPSGIYRLNVPTGGGKTLSAMRFAAAHALEKGKRRIIYVAPLISILEQNAEVIRKAVGNPDWVLEHHSNVIHEQEDAEELKEQELLLENWNAPIIVTTMVQLLNTLFLFKTSNIRRFHALTNSVLILDEVQTVPTNMLSLFNLAMNFLAEICGSTILLCSATQPCLEKTEHAMRIRHETPVVINDVMRSSFKRTEIKISEKMQWTEIPQFIREKMEHHKSLLVICNKKGEAEQLFNLLNDNAWKCFHLSASMCMAHRRNIIQKMYAALEESQSGNGKTLCIATQVIEAGVDISFESVIRLSAGMDSIVQAAGRCNRNGETTERAPVYIVDCIDENLTALKDIRAGKEATESLLYSYQRNSAQFENDLASDAAIDYYYRQLYSAMNAHFQDDTIRELDNATLFDLLSQNIKYTQNAKEQFPHFMIQSFKTAGKHFSVFDSDTTDVIVPYQEGRKIIQRLIETDVFKNLKEAQSLICQAKQFTVSLYDHQVRNLQKQGLLFPVAGGTALALAEGYYSEQTGILSQSQNNSFLEV